MEFPPTGASWMQDNLSWFKDYPIRDILHLPGSHNAGMSVSTHLSLLATSDHTLNQTKSIYEQLMYGARWLDIRPALWKGDLDWRVGRIWTPFEGDWEGGTGLLLTDVIDQINQFTAQHKELVVLRITHVWQPVSGRETDLQRQVELVDDLLFKRLLHVYHAPSNFNPLDKPLSEFISENSNACVLLVFDADATEAPLIAPGILENRGIDITGFPMKSCSVTAVQSQRDIVHKSPVGFVLGHLPRVGALFSAEAKTAKSLKQGVPDVLACRLPSAPSEMLQTTGGLDYSTEARILELDDVCDDVGLNICLAASRACWATKNFEKSKHYSKELIIYYGGQRITEASVVSGIQTRIEKGENFPVTAALMGTDPWVGKRKSCCICYSEWRSADQGNGLFWKARFARENDWIDFAADIGSMVWHTTTMTGDYWRQTYASMIGHVINRTPFSPWVGSTIAGPDPAVGVVKNLTINFRSAAGPQWKQRRINEKYMVDFGRDIREITYQDRPLSTPKEYEPFFARIDGLESKLTITNDLFGSDPAPGVRKTCKITWETWEHFIRIKIGDEEEDPRECPSATHTCMEGDLWDPWQSLVSW